MVFTTAFTDYNGGNIPRYVGFDNSIFIIGNMAAETVIETLKFTSMSLVFGFFAGVLLAWIVNMMPGFLRGFFTLALAVPMLIGGLYMACSEIYTYVSALGFLAVLGGIRLVPRERYEAAAIEGIRNRVQEFALITIPAIKPQLLFAAVMQVAAAFAPQAEVLKYSGVFELGQAATVCVVVFIPMLAVYFALRVLFRSGRCDVE